MRNTLIQTKIENIEQHFNIHSGPEKKHTANISNGPIQQTSSQTVKITVVFRKLVEHLFMMDGKLTDWIKNIVIEKR